LLKNTIINILNNVISPVKAWVLILVNYI
jgi:hypothetical protein